MLYTSSMSPFETLRAKSLKTSLTSPSVSALGSCLNAASTRSRLPQSGVAHGRTRLQGWKG